MKKSLFAMASVFALLASMPAFADSNNNTSTIEQIGNGVTANVTQGGDGNTSISDIEQGQSVSGDNLTHCVPGRLGYQQHGQHHSKRHRSDGRC